MYIDRQTEVAFLANWILSSLNIHMHYIVLLLCYLARRVDLN